MKQTYDILICPLKLGLKQNLKPKSKIVHETGPWSICFSHICIFILHVSFSLGVGGWLRLVTVAHGRFIYLVTHCGTTGRCDVCNACYCTTSRFEKANAPPTFSDIADHQSSP